MKLSVSSNKLLEPPQTVAWSSEYHINSLHRLKSSQRVVSNNKIRTRGMRICMRHMGWKRSQWRRTAVKRFSVRYRGDAIHVAIEEEDRNHVISIWVTHAARPQPGATTGAHRYGSWRSDLPSRWSAVSSSALDRCGVAMRAP